jgi:hypothetical protein
MGGTCSTNGEGRRRRMHLDYCGKSKKKETTGRPRHRWVHNIRVDLGRIGNGGMDGVGLVQDMDQVRALVYKVISLQVP